MGEFKYKARQGKLSQPDKQVNSNSAFRRSEECRVQAVGHSFVLHITRACRYKECSKDLSKGDQGEESKR